MSDEINAGHLRSFIERVERLTEEKRELAEDIKEVLGEAKSFGFEPKIIRKIVAIRARDTDQRVEEETLVELYLAAVGSA